MRLGKTSRRHTEDKDRRYRRVEVDERCGRDFANDFVNQLSFPVWAFSILVFAIHSESQKEGTFVTLKVKQRKTEVMGTHL